MLAVAYTKNHELRVAIQYNKMVGQPAQQHKSTNNTSQHIYTKTYKTIPGSPRTATYLVAHFFYPKVFDNIAKMLKGYQQNTMHFPQTRQSF